MKEELLKLKKQLEQTKKTGYPSIDRTHEKEYSFTKRHPMIPNMSIYNALKFMNLPYRNTNAIDYMNLKISYKELFDMADTLSKGFKELGIKSSDIITVNMPNTYQAVAIYLAANRIGATVAFLNPGCSLTEVERYLNLFASPLYINYNQTEEQNKTVKEKTHVNQIITLSAKDILEKSFNDKKKEFIGYSDFVSYHDLKLIGDFYKKFINTNFSGNQNSSISFTSGSTGEPKALVLTNKNVLSSGIYMKNTGNIEFVPHEKCLACVPFSYPYGLYTSAIMTLLCNRELILASDISKDTIAKFLRKNPNYIYGSPALVELILRNIDESQSLSSVHSVISGGDFLSISKYNEAKEFFKNHGAENIEIYNGSGNAENCGASTIAVGGKVRPETVGRVLAGSKAIIVDPETKKELKYGEEGILCVSGKHVFKGYFQNDEKTKQSKLNFNGREYYITGNIGSLDEKGYFTLTGRESRFYIRSDLNKVYLEHIQSFISAIDVVDRCVVVKQPDKDLLYTGKAYIVLKPGVIGTEELKEIIRKKCLEPIVIGDEVLQLKDFEIPCDIEFIDDIKLTRADKVDYEYYQNLAIKEQGSSLVKKVGSN